MFGQELRTLGVLLGGGGEGAVASLNPFTELVRAVRFHILGTTDGIEILEGEAVLKGTPSDYDDPAPSQPYRDPLPYSKGHFYRVPLTFELLIMLYTSNGVWCDNFWITGAVPPIIFPLKSDHQNRPHDLLFQNSYYYNAYMPT